MDSKCPETTISEMLYFFSWLHKPREEQVQLLYFSYQVNFFFKKDLGVTSNNFDVGEFSTSSPKMLVFRILLNSKSHGKQFSQVERHERIDLVWMNVDPLIFK